MITKQEFVDQVLLPAPFIILHFVTPTLFAVIKFLTETTAGIYVKPQHKTLIKQNFTKLLISKIVHRTSVSFSDLIRYNKYAGPSEH